MSNDWEKREGILLHTFSHLGNHRILKVFTGECGLISFFAKDVNLRGTTWATPFCRAEWVFKRSSQSDLFALKDATLLDPLLLLRESYDRIASAGSIASDILRSQYPHKSSQNLYALLVACLHHLSRHPEAIAQAFRLKLLQCEGLLHLQSTCMRCDAPASHLSSGESVCVHHATPHHHFFETTEWPLLLLLGLFRRFSELETLSLPRPFLEKMARLFAERID